MEGKAPAALHSLPLPAGRGRWGMVYWTRARHDDPWTKDGKSLPWFFVSRFPEFPQMAVIDLKFGPLRLGLAWPATAPKG